MTPTMWARRLYSFTFSQLDAFAAGAALVVFRHRLSGKSAAGFALLTALLLVGGQAASLVTKGKWILDSSLGYEINMLRAGQHIWGYTLINLWSAALILLVNEKAAVARLLSHPAGVFLGKISYGMYVFHLLVQQEVLAILGHRHSLGNLAVFTAYLGLLTAVCWLSYRYYESYFLNRKDGRFRRPARVSAAAVSGANAVVRMESVKAGMKMSKNEKQ